MAGKIIVKYSLVDLGFSESSPFVGDSAGMKKLKAVRDKGMNSTENATSGKKYIINSRKSQESHFKSMDTSIFIH